MCRLCYLRRAQRAVYWDHVPLCRNIGQGACAPPAWQRRDTRRYHPARPRRPARSVRRGPCAAWRPITSKEVPTMSATTLFSIGEALIDMIPSQSGCAFAEVPAFRPRVGGAPANVCGAFTALGGRSALLTQLGDDPFGHKIAAELASHGIDVSRVPFTTKANTALAFVSLGADGNRTFSFYRNPSADLLYSASQIDPAWFQDAFALHFCSVSLVDSPMKAAHDAAIAAAAKAGAIISFDPNLRFPLWSDHDALKRT